MVELDGGSETKSNTDSGGGAGGYPAAGIGRWSELVEVGGDHACSAGGYSCGVGQAPAQAGSNGLGSIDIGPGNSGWGVGGGYYSYGISHSNLKDPYEGWFGLGGCCLENWNGNTWSTAGSGGTAGKGGSIKYSPDATINAYNGNRITDDMFDYSKIYYEYDEDGNLLDGTDGKEKKEARTISFINDASKKIIPARIFIQDGIKRAVYDNLCYMSEGRKKQYGVNGEVAQEKIKNTSKTGSIKCVKIIEENISMLHFMQGIGSRSWLHRT